MSIREATAADWDAIWPIWQATVEAGETYAFPLGLNAEEARGWWMNDHVVVFDDPELGVLGSAKMGPNRPGRGAHVGTASLMVAEQARGRGIGRALGEYMIDWHRRQSFRSIQFNAVVETNTAAVRLWQDLGFGVVGTVPEAFDSATHGLVGLHVMHLALTE